MKRQYAVTVVVTVHGDSDHDFAAAVARLRQKGPYTNVTSAGEWRRKAYAFCAVTNRRGALRVKRLPTRSRKHKPQ